ncbi:hypothetical protein ACHAWT_004249 [Skeletonema menzelii]
MTETKPGEPVAEPTAVGTPANVYDHSTPAATAETAVAAGDVEAQKDAPAPAAATSEYDDEAGKGIGIAMFVCIVVGFCLGWIPAIGPFITFVCLIAAIVLSSTITCGCCCGKGLNLNPKVKRWSTATLLCLVLQWVLALIGIIVGVSIAAAGGASSSVVTTTNSDGSVTWTTVSSDGTTSEAAVAITFAVLIICQILYILAGVFAGIFTWGRKCCGNA